MGRAPVQPSAHPVSHIPNPHHAMTRVLLLLLLAAPVAAQPTPPAEAPVEAPPAEARRPVSLYADLRAFQAGDLLTVILAERTSARREASSQVQSSASVGGSASVPATLGGAFGLDAQFGQNRDADSRTLQSDLLTGTITARVVSVDAAGNLTIEGERRLSVDGAAHTMRVRGTVRPTDVRTGNTVYSFQIAGADVEYAQEGGGPKFLRSRFLTGLGTVAVLIGAIVLGASAGGAAN